MVLDKNKVSRPFDEFLMTLYFIIENLTMILMECRNMDIVAHIVREVTKGLCLLKMFSFHFCVVVMLMAWQAKHCGES